MVFSMVHKEITSINKKQSNPTKEFEPLQIVFENNHNAGQLIDLFAQGIGMDEINILELADVDNKDNPDAGKADRNKFTICQPMGFQFYSKFIVLYYTFEKVTQTKVQRDPQGVGKGNVANVTGVMN